MEIITAAVLGRLIIWTFQSNGLLNPLFSKNTKLRELISCDFCLGFWIFTGLAHVFGLNLLSPVYVPILSEAITGLVASFVSHLMRLGWETKFGVTNLGEFHDPQ